MESDYFHLLLYKYITPSEYMYHIVSYFYRVFCFVYLSCFYKQTALKIFKKKRLIKMF